MKRILILGNFDGVHLGHRALLKQARDVEKVFNMKPLIVSLDTHPFLFFGKDIKLLNTNSEKTEIFRKLNFDIEYLNFNKETAELSFKDYIAFLCTKYDVGAIIAGENHTFGKNAQGKARDLVSLSKIFNYKIFIVPNVKINGETVSSSLIRNFITQGEIKKANTFLGYNYFVTGTVQHGHQIGTELGFPTANLICEKSKLLPSGVFVTNVLVNNCIYKGITNIGSRPTVNLNKDITIETHILDLNEDLYEKKIKIEFLSKIRDEIKFTSKEELAKQISMDYAIAIAFFNFKSKEGRA